MLQHCNSEVSLLWIVSLNCISTTVNPKEIVQMHCQPSVAFRLEESLFVSY